MPRGRYKKLKLYADDGVPEPLIQELRGSRIVVHSARAVGSPSRPNQSIYQEARRLGMVLLTMDRDFWNDRLQPLRTSPEIIFVDTAPCELGKACDGLARFHALFADYWPLDWWP